MALPQSIFVAESTWPEIETFVKSMGDKAIAVLGWGATEQHGLRLFEGTDTMIADYFAQQIAAKRTVMVYPTMPYGMSRHHEAFPGTVSFSAEVTTAAACCILRSIYRTGIRKVFALMGHGGNVKPFKAAIESLGKEIEGMQVVEYLDGLFYVKEGTLGHLINEETMGEAPSHAGALEASVLYGLLLEQDQPGEVSRLEEITIIDEMVVHGTHGQGTQGGDPLLFRRMFPYGMKGDQRNGRGEIGQRILDLMVAEILTKFDEFAKS